MKIAIVSDSSIGENNTKIKDLFVLPLNISINDKEIKDDKNLSTEDFLKMLEKEKLKTSFTSFSDIYEQFDEILKSYDFIIVCGIAQKLSGQYNNFLTISKEEKYLNKVFVVDSNGTSIILEAVVVKIRELIDKNYIPENIVKEITKFNSKYETYIIPKSWKTLKNSGRVSKFNAFIAQTLKIVVVLKQENGGIILESKQRSFFLGIRHILSELRKKYPNSKKIDVGFGFSDEVTIIKVKQLIEKYGFKINLLSLISKPIMIHTGYETFAFSVWEGY